MVKLIQNRRIKLLIACIALLLFVDLVQDTYAKYVTSTDATSNFTIARWSFLVNNQDVVSNNNFSNTIVPIFDENQNIKNGVIAPTSTGYFDITIDSSNVGVSFDEEISLLKNTTNTVDDIVFTGYKKNDDEIIEFANETTSITTTHLLNEERTVNTYRIYIKWNDGDGSTMDNTSDTEASKNGIAAIKVNIRFIQRAT